MVGHGVQLAGSLENNKLSSPTPLLFEPENALVLSCGSGANFPTANFDAKFGANFGDSSAVNLQFYSPPRTLRSDPSAPCAPRLSCAWRSYSSSRGPLSPSMRALAPSHLRIPFACSSSSMSATKPKPSCPLVWRPPLLRRAALLAGPAVRASIIIRRSTPYCLIRRLWHLHQYRQQQLRSGCPSGR